MTDRKPPYDQNETPEDVATLYSWANLHGAKYRDFSASRAQTREQVRLRVQQALEAEQAGAKSIPEPSRVTPPQFDQSALSQTGPQPPVSSAVSYQPEPYHPEAFPTDPFAPRSSYRDASRIDYRTEADRAAEVVRAAEAARMAEESRQAELLTQYNARKAAEQAAEEEAARQEAEEARRQEAEEQAARHAAEEAAARQREEEAAKQHAAEIARQQAEEAARREAEEAAARQAAEEAARQHSAEIARQQAEEAARQEAEEAAARQAAEEAARQHAAEIARQQAEEAARQEAEEAAARQAAEEAARQHSAEIARQQAEEAARREAEEAAARQAAEEAARLQAEEAARQHAAEIARQQAEEAARQQAEEEARKQAEEEAARQYAAEIARRQAEQAARREAEEAASRHAAEEAARQQAEEEARKQEEEEAARQHAAEIARQQAEEAARREAEEAAARQQAEEAARQKAEEEARQQAEEAARQHSAEIARQEAEEAAQQQFEEAARRAAEEATRQQAEAEAREQAEEAARQEAELAAKELAEQEAREAAAREASERAVHEAALQAEAARQALAAQWAAQRAQAVPPPTWPALHSSPSVSEVAPEPPAMVQPAVPPPPFDYPAYAYAKGPARPASEPLAASLPHAPFEGPVQVPAPAPSPFAGLHASVPLHQPSGHAAPPQVPPYGAAHAEPFEPGERPAWLTPERPDFPAQPTVPQAPEDTLQGSRDRLTSRWYALRGVFDTLGTPIEAAPAPAPARAPVVAIFSLAGGVGKTSMVATMGRALSSRGERVLLVDTAAYGLLPFFFGAHDQRPGQLRTFSPPGTSTDAPIQMVTIDPDSLGTEATNQEALCSEIGKFSRGVSRVIVDLATASGATTRRVLKMAPLVLVPMVPDMNSVVSVSSIDSFFQHNPNPAMKSAMPYYVLNQFDPSLPLHLDIREVLREQLGERLLPFVLRRAAAVSEALAEGMTVMDYAPNSTVAEDFGALAGWVKTQSAPASSTYRGVRWSER